MLNLRNVASSLGLVMWNIGWFISTFSFGFHAVGNRHAQHHAGGGVSLSF